jgi:hypothetical protein
MVSSMRGHSKVILDTCDNEGLDNDSFPLEEPDRLGVWGSILERHEPRLRVIGDTVHGAILAPLLPWSQSDAIRASSFLFLESSVPPRW